MRAVARAVAHGSARGGARGTTRGAAAAWPRHGRSERSRSFSLTLRLPSPPLAAALAAAVGPSGAVFAFDIDPLRLKQLAASAQRAGAGGVVRVVPTAEALGRLPDDFDAVREETQ